MTTRLTLLPLAALRRLVEWVLIGLVGIMLVAVLAQVLGRYVFNFSIA